MSQAVANEDLEAALAYEQLHVPALFGQWAPVVATAAEIGAGQDVLDVACGTGVLAREAADRTGSPARVSGVDPAPGMLAAARELAPDINWRLGEAESLPFGDDTFDTVVSQFGLMFFPDKPAAVREMRRVLRPGGTIAVAVWDSLESAPAYAEAVDLLQRLAGPQAADALKAPFALGDCQFVREIFADAGFDDIALSTHSGRARFPAIRNMMEAELRGWLPIMGVNLDEPTIEAILNEAEQVLQPFTRPDGSTDFEVHAHIVVTQYEEL